MTLRTTGLIAGVIGVIVLIVGFVADSVRPPEDVVANAEVATSVVVYQPDFLTISPQGVISIEGDGDVVAYTARPVDAAEWLTEVRYTEVASLPEWEELGTAEYEIPAPEASPSPSASPDASASATPSPTPTEEAKASPSPSASPSASASPEADAVPTATDPFVATEGRATDHWRDAFTGTDRLDISVADVPSGLTLVIMSVNGSALTETSLSLTRAVNDEWITPLLWWGAILVVVGIIALIVLFIDLRPAQARGESWMASRKVTDGGEANPGSRRSRRAAGAAIPTVSLDGEPTRVDGGLPEATQDGPDDGPTSKKTEDPS